MDESLLRRRTHWGVWFDVENKPHMQLQPDKGKDKMQMLDDSLRKDQDVEGFDLVNRIPSTYMSTHHNDSCRLTQEMRYLFTLIIRTVIHHWTFSCYIVFGGTL